jgi:hypothetical protein
MPLGALLFPLRLMGMGKRRISAGQVRLQGITQRLPRDRSPERHLFVISHRKLIDGNTNGMIAHERSKGGNID